MDGYVIQDTKSGKYVARPGSESSFTKSIIEARKFPTREIADKEKCDCSEVVRNVRDILGN